MLAFFCPEEVTVNFQNFQRTYKPVITGSPAAIDRLYVYLTGEVQLIHQRYAQIAHPGSKPKEIGVVDEQALLDWSLFPPRLGRVSAKFFSAQLTRFDEPNTLVTQCSLLKDRYRTKRHFRFVVINAFGTNLGDTMMGMTAIRVVARVLSERFDSFSIDLVLGLQAGVARRQMIGNHDWLGQTFFEAPTVQQLSRYDGYFDFTNPVRLDRYGEMPVVDWYLWWFGLDPQETPEDEKRNNTCIDPSDWARINEILSNVRSEQKILFNPNASVPLRSCEKLIAKDLALGILEFASDVILILDTDLGVKHDRILNLSDIISSPGLFQALVCQVDALVTVDTFSFHVADCANVPTIMLSASVPKENFPYYPNCKIIEIPDARNLPFWGATNTPSTSEWELNKEKYYNSWRNLNVDDLLVSLNCVIQSRKEGSPNPRKRVMVSKTKEFPNAVQTVADSPRLRYETTTPVWDNACLIMRQVLHSYLKRGSSVVAVTVGDTDTLIEIATSLGPLGVLHIFEPRAIRLSTLAFNIYRETDLQRLFVHPALPGEPSGDQPWIRAIDPYSESYPEQWGNIDERVPLMIKSIKEAMVESCDAIVLMPPCPLLEATRFVTALLHDYSPMILIGPSSRAEANLMNDYLSKMAYNIFVRDLPSNEIESRCLLLASRVLTHVGGFIKV